MVPDFRMFAAGKPVPTLLSGQVEGKAKLLPILKDGLVPFREEAMQEVLLSCSRRNSVPLTSTTAFNKCLYCDLCKRQKELIL